MPVEILLPQPEHLLQPRFVGAHRHIVRPVELRAEHRRQRVVAGGIERRREAVVAEPAIAFLRDEAGVLEQAQMP